MSNNHRLHHPVSSMADALPPLAEILNQRSILITGATGFLGKVLVYLLLRHHPELKRLYLLIRGDSKSSFNRFSREILDSPVMGPLREHLEARFNDYVEQRVVVLPGDITNPDLVSGDAGLSGDGRLDAVIHCAGLVNFEASLEKALTINVVGVKHVIDFCRKHGATLIHISTCYAAGAADGHRFEDDLPLDWCPNGQPKFSLQREIKDALAACERIEAESRDQSHQAQFRQDTEYEGATEDRELAHESRRKQWVEERLKQIGRERALGWGWPNTYSYSKSLGEQLVLSAHDLTATVVRPSVIESALKDPLPGWNQGVNTSAPLTYLSGRGYRFYPARPRLVLDVIPVDLAAHAIIPIMGALLLKHHQPIYQLCTSDVNPLPMRRLVELTALSNRREQRRTGDGPMGKLAPHLEAVVVSQNTYELVSKTLPAILQQAAGLANTLAGEHSAARKFEQRITRICESTELARSLVEVYLPYIQELAYTFHGRNIRELYSGLARSDAAQHPFQPEKIDWNDYWMNIHLPGLRRHIFPQLDLHTRGRPRPLLRHKTLVELLERAAKRFGSRVALEARKPSGQRSSLSYRELRDGARRAGLLMATRGLKAGERVLLVGENSPDWVLAYFAILYAGAVAVPLDHLISADELVTICRIAQPRAVLASAACAERLGDCLHETIPGILELELGELRRPFLLRGKAQAQASIERKTLASIVFTSGTTGAPKGVMLTHGNFAAEIMMLGRVFALDSSDVVLSLLPLHHTFEFTCGMLLPLASGARIVYPLGLDAASLSRTLADVRPTALIGVPALWEAVHRRILDQVEAGGPFYMAAFDRLRDFNRRLGNDYHLNLGHLIFRPAHTALGGRLKLAVSGGAALPPRVAQFFSDIGIKLLEGYGLTESAPVLSVARPDEPLVSGSVGKPLSGVEVRLDTAPGSEVGEIVVRGPNVMTGYFCNQAATEEVLKEGWLYTGDLGRFDQEGRLYIVGRAKDVIIDSGGNNIYIDELEQVYGRSPFVKEIAVVGLKVGQGEQAAALVVPAYARGESRRAVEDRLREYFEQVSASLNPHKRIRILRFTDSELPRTRTRKLKRAEVAILLQRMLGSHIGERRATNTEIEPWLLHALAQVARDVESISPATHLIEDLGLDSLALAELAEHIAIKSGRELSPEQLSNVSTVADLQRVIGEGQNRPRLPSYAQFARPYVIELPGALQRLGQYAMRRSLEAAFQRVLRPRIMGRGNIPANRNLLVVANHASHVDFGLVSYALGTMGRELVVLAAKDYFFNNGIRRFIATNFTRLIPFDRERAQLESLDEAMAELAAGRSVLMFPEGTRSPDGAIYDFKSGVGYLALNSGCDVLPIRIDGTHAVLGKGSLIPRPAPVELRIGTVITNDDLRMLVEDVEGAGAYRKLADHLRATVIGLSQPAARPRLTAKLAAKSSKKTVAAHPLPDKAGGGRSHAHKRA
ncbi:MAG: AMP-binding protein [Deltaproteobacteria bacterium]|nr:AMP-binding protein [Deltaproteobacteria bacterium]